MGSGADDGFSLQEFRQLLISARPRRIAIQNLQPSPPPPRTPSPQPTARSSIAAVPSTVRMPGRWPTAKKAASATAARRRSVHSPSLSPSSRRRVSPTSSNPGDSYSPDIFASPSPSSRYMSPLVNHEAIIEDYGSNTPFMIGERAGTPDVFWSPRPAMSDASSVSSSPRRQIFNDGDAEVDDFRSHISSPLSESDDEGAYRSQRMTVSSLKRRCSEVTRRFHESERSHRRADEQMHALQRKIDELESELAEKRKENSDLRTREANYLQQVETVGSEIFVRCLLGTQDCN